MMGEAMGETGFEGDRRPGGRTVTWRQLGVLLLDGSISMKDDVEGVEGFVGSKATAVNSAVRELLGRFRISDNAQNFTIAVVKFHTEVSEEFPPTPALEVDLFGNYDPTSPKTGQTFIGAGLDRAGEICEQFFSDYSDDPTMPVTAIILLQTDGQCLQMERTREIAQRLKQNPRIKLAGAYFATKNKAQEGKDFLQSICSHPTDYFTTAYDPETLRKFWEETFKKSALER